jgi:hypothetical protein
MTKTIAFAAAFLGVALPGCSDEADIGVELDPVGCLPNGPTGAVEGTLSVSNPNGTYTHSFGAATVELFTNPDTGGPMVQLSDNELILRLDFRCGPAERDKRYSLIGDGRQQALACPDEAYGTILGQIEILPADSGVALVDEGAPSSNCLAGRFGVDFGSAGELTGWFSTPWQ